MSGIMEGISSRKVAFSSFSKIGESSMILPNEPELLYTGWQKKNGTAYFW